MERGQKNWHLWEEQKIRESKDEASRLGPKSATLPYSDLVTMMRHLECPCRCIVFVFWALVSVPNDNPWGIIFPETTSLFMDCLKLIVQFSSDKNKAQGIHVSSLPERRITRRAGPWECLFTNFCHVHSRILFRLTFNVVMCCHASTPSPPYPQTKYQGKNCPLVIFSRPS